MLERNRERYSDIGVACREPRREARSKGEIAREDGKVKSSGRRGDRERKEEDSKGYYFPIVPFIITRVRGLKKGKEIYD